VVCLHVIVGIGLLSARKFIVANNVSTNKLHILAHLYSVTSERFSEIPYILLFDIA